MSEFFESVDELKKAYSDGFITFCECHNQIIYMVERHWFSYAKELPEDFISILKQYSLGLTKETYNYQRWSRFISRVLMLYDYPSDEFKKRAESVFSIKYVQYQKFIVQKSFTSNLRIYLRAPFSDGGEIQLKKGLILFTDLDTYQDDVEMCFKPVDYFGFFHNEVEPIFGSDDLMITYYMEIEINTVELYCKILDETISKEDAMRFIKIF